MGGLTLHSEGIYFQIFQKVSTIHPAWAACGIALLPPKNGGKSHGSLEWFHGEYRCQTPRNYDNYGFYSPCIAHRRFKLRNWMGEFIYIFPNLSNFIQYRQIPIG